jgi:UDP-N-acetyl-alpha-D-muramoyl-L-alanyl-L-glutamate epimerase
VPLLASDPARNEQLGHLRDSHPVFRVEDARAVVDGGTVRNSIEFTSSGFLRISAPPGLSPATEDADRVPGSQACAPPLVMFSGGKDSLALTYAIRDEVALATDFFLYNPTEGQQSLAESLASGGRIIEARRQVLPELLTLNASGHPNGHTPYSAYLAFAALLAGYLRGQSHGAGWQLA